MRGNCLRLAILTREAGRQAERWSEIGQCSIELVSKRAVTVTLGRVQIGTRKRKCALALLVGSTLAFDWFIVYA